VIAVRCQVKCREDLDICSVYMPSNDNSFEYSVAFEETTGCLQGVIDQCLGSKFVIGSDFNVVKAAARTQSSSSL